MVMAAEKEQKQSGWMSPYQRRAEVVLCHTVRSDGTVAQLSATVLACTGVRRYRAPGWLREGVRIMHSRTKGERRVCGSYSV
jgi:hypothetical protein